MTTVQPGSLTLIFESGKPCATAPFALGDVDAVTLSRASATRTARLSTVGGERRLTLEIADRRMSVVHAHLRLVAEGWSLEDASSKNGTRVNGVDVARTILRNGDLVEVGRSFFVFRDNVPHPSRPDAPEPPLGLGTRHPALARQFENLMTIARSSVAIVVHGETGTGKELIARAVHQLSGRTGPLQALNCGALSRSLLESELFGYRKGAFSGANEDRPGLIRAADKGTLFLDEIGDLPLDGQAALLRVLQEGELLPVGGVKPIPVDVRIVAATHRDLGEMVAREAFRADLLARLTGFTVVLPPLRARREDLGALLRSLFARHAPSPSAPIELSAAAIRALYGYPWPGNVRELEKVIATALILADGMPIEEDHLSDAVRAVSPHALPPASAEDALPGAAEHDTASGSRERLEGLLARHQGNVNAVAREMRTSRTQIHRLCRRFGIDLRVHRFKRL
ncbi:MAG TPA: sigma 54-interacting transcriptional regulator [Kofleriaceae bacterium]|nr:sigma 54-interacting transcriptional regulator [Kofleriaceae bacterium]